MRKKLDREVIKMNKNKTNINCLITIYLTPSLNSYFIGDYDKIDDAYFI